MTTKGKIIAYLGQYDSYISGSQLEAQGLNWGTKSSVISRRARELANEGKIERRIGDKRTVQYRAIPYVPPMTALIPKRVSQEQLFDKPRIMF